MRMRRIVAGSECAGRRCLRRRRRPVNAPPALALAASPASHAADPALAARPVRDEPGGRQAHRRAHQPLAADAAGRGAGARAGGAPAPGPAHGGRGAAAVRVLQQHRGARGGDGKPGDGGAAGARRAAGAVGAAARAGPGVCVCVPGWRARQAGRPGRAASMAPPLPPDGASADALRSTPRRRRASGRARCAPSATPPSWRPRLPPTRGAWRGTSGRRAARASTTSSSA